MTIRAHRPAAQSVTAILAGDKTVELAQIHPGGVFEGVAEGAELPLSYQLKVDYGASGTFEFADPYAFPPTLGELDLHLIGEGRHERLYELLGAHIREHENVLGTAFAVWAPAPRSVSVVGDFNSWDGRLHPMRSLGPSGIWELFIPGLEAGSRYKYEILTQDQELRLKADPYAFETEIPPETASVVNRSQHQWSDGDAAWLERRAEQMPLSGPMSIYEVHLDSWRLNPLEDNRSLELPRAGRRAIGLCPRYGVHPRRVAAGDGTSVHRLVGLPGDGLLRAHPAPRLARRDAGVRPATARERPRRDPRLGPGTFPAR